MAWPCSRVSDFVALCVAAAIRGHASNPYAGIVFLVLPVDFFTGLGLFPIGVYLSERQVREGLLQSQFNRKSALRRMAWFFRAVTLLNILIGTQLTYRSVTYMETPQFSGASSSDEF